MSPIEFYAYLLILAPLLVLLVFLLILVLLESVNWLRRSSRQRAGLREAREQEFSPDGLPYPPSGRGMCDNCQVANDRVYYMPSGKRLCVDCYRELGMPAEDQLAQ